MVILVDLDGVVANFIDAVDKTHGRKLDWSTWHGGFETVEEFWRPINEAGEKFWLDIQPYPWANQLVKDLSSLVDGRLYFCTSPAKEPCSTAKVNWIARYMPKKLHRNFIITSHKHLLAGPRTFLVDDSDYNCLEFEKAGGKAVLFPQPWNEGRTQLPMTGRERVEYTMKQLYLKTIEQTRR